MSQRVTQHGQQGDGVSAQSGSQADVTARRIPALRASALLLALLASTGCSRQPPSAGPCEQRVARWAARLSAVTSTSAATRIAQIEAAARQVGDDPQECTTDLVGAALDGELRKVLRKVLQLNV